MKRRIVEQSEETERTLPTGHKYWAFVSYSQTDREWADWLHDEIEEYHVPRKLVGRKTSFGSIPPRLFPIFRDREELASGSDLGEQLEMVLGQSLYLIVICSPHSAASRWVNEEIEKFKGLGREDRILCMVIAGEPNASAELGEVECFAPALCRQIGGDGEPTEVLAADAREGRDGRANAKLKLIAGILGVGFDELWQREKRRRFRRRLRAAGVAAAIGVIAMAIYLAIADAGLAVPGGTRVRTFLDRREMSIFRAIPSDLEVERTITAMRRELFKILAARRSESGQILTKAARVEEFGVWTQSQGLFGAFTARDCTEAEVRPFVSSMALLSAPGLLIEQGGIKYGWGRLDPPTGQAECTLFVAAASAAALRRPRLLSEPEAAIFGRLFSEAVESLKQYRADDAGGWNMYPNQSNPAEHNLYSSTIALLTLLEARAAALPWEGSVEKRDALLRSTAGWLMQQFQSDLNPPGWEAPGDSANPMIDGLTLQIYAELLRAESEAGVVLLPEIVRTIPRHAANCAQRGVDYPVERAEYQTRVKQADGHANLEIESINMLWYPWAIDCSARWLARTKIHPAPLDEIVGVRRALGHLTVGIREAAIRKAASDWTYVCAESLYSLSLLPDPAGK